MVSFFFLDCLTEIRRSEILYSGMTISLLKSKQFLFFFLNQMQILDAFRSKQSEEHARYNALLSHQRGHSLVIRKKWRQLKQFLIGPRGSWAQR